MSVGGATAVGVAATGARKRDTLAVRWIGFYLAGSAGVIQLLDIFADRLQLPEQAFVYVVILAVIGLPITAAGAFLRAIGVRERRGQRGAKALPRRSVEARRAGDAGVPGSHDDVAAAHRSRRSGTDPDASTPGLREHSSGIAASDSEAPRSRPGASIALTAELELAFSHLQIAKLRASEGDDQAAGEHYETFLHQAAIVRDRIDSAMDQVTRLRGTEE